jgi:hypothetical protein
VCRLCMVSTCLTHPVNGGREDGERRTASCQPRDANLLDPFTHLVRVIRARAVDGRWTMGWGGELLAGPWRSLPNVDHHVASVALQMRPPPLPAAAPGILTPLRVQETTDRHHGSRSQLPHLSPANALVPGPDARHGGQPHLTFARLRLARIEDTATSATPTEIVHSP